MTDSQPPPRSGRHRVPAAPVQPQLSLRLQARWRMLGWVGMASVAAFAVLFVAAVVVDSEEHPVASVLLGAGALLATLGAAVSMFTAAHFSRRPTPPEQR